MKKAVVLVIVSLCILVGIAFSQDYDLKTMNKESLAKIDSTGLHLDLNLIRLDPSLLNSPPVMNYFIMLNNCSPVTGHVDPRIEKLPSNELDLPKVAAFYKSKAPAILAPLSRTGSSLISGRGAKLGPYDQAKQMFPIVSPNWKIQFLSFDVNDPRYDLAQWCSAASRQLQAASDLPKIYSVALAPPNPTYDHVSMDEAAARKYIESANANQRGVNFIVDFNILDTPAPRLGKQNGNSTATMSAEVTKITVVRALQQNMPPIAVLYDRASAAH